MLQWCYVVFFLVFLWFYFSFFSFFIDRCKCAPLLVFISVLSCYSSVSSNLSYWVSVSFYHVSSPFFRPGFPPNVFLIPPLLSLLCLPPPPPPVTHQVWLFIVIAIVMVRSGAWLIDWFNSLVWWFNLSVLFFAPRYLQYFAVFFLSVMHFFRSERYLEIARRWDEKSDGVRKNAMLRSI